MNLFSSEDFLADKSGKFYITKINKKYTLAIQLILKKLIIDNRIAKCMHHFISLIYILHIFTTLETPSKLMTNRKCIISFYFLSSKCNFRINCGKDD